MSRRRAAVSVFVALALVGGGLAVILTRGHGRVEIAGSVPPILSHSRRLGPLPATKRLLVSVVLPPRDDSSLDDLLRAVSDPGSSDYGHYLSHAQVSARIGPDPGAVGAVSGYLRGHGFSVIATSGWMVRAAGSVHSVESVFGVRLYRWRETRTGEVFFANDSAITVPASFGSSVSAVFGLDDSVHLRPGAFAGSDGKVGLSPDQLREAYDVRALKESDECRGLPCDGSGQTVAVYAEGGFKRHDLEVFDPNWNLASVTEFSYAGADALASSSEPRPLWVAAPMPWSRSDREIEAELDIETVHAVAPGAAIEVYELPVGASVADGMIPFLDEIVSSRASIASISYSASADESDPGLLATFEFHFYTTVMASQGQSLFAASGDLGRLRSDGKVGVAFPASLPGVTAVGGTQLELNPATRFNPNGTYKNETPWDEGANHASGGGVSLYPQPWWQSGVSNAAHRLVPDVAADADPRSVLGVYAFSDELFSDDDDQWQQVGGTSASAPAWAGFAAILNQYAASHEARPLGFANPALYSLAAHRQAFEPFFDVTANGKIDDLAGPARPGWDIATGLGSFNAYNLARDLFPSLVADPSFGPSGTEVDVTAYPFATGDTVQFSWDSPGNVLCTAAVDETHTASCSGTIQSDAPEASVLRLLASDQASVTTARGAFALENSPPRGPGTIVFDCPNRPGATCLMEPDGSDLETVKGVCCEAALSPDGTKLTWSDFNMSPFERGRPKLHMAGADGSNDEVLLAPLDGDVHSPSWSPQGARIAFLFSRYDSYRNEIDVIDADGGNRDAVFTGSRAIGAPAWSPDGTELAFPTDSGGIDAVDISTHRIRHILGPQDGRFISGLSWSPSASILYLEQVGEAPSTIQEIDGVGGAARAVPGTTGLTFPSWAPDGVHFLAIDDGAIVVTTADGGLPEAVGPTGVDSAQWGGS